MPTTAPDRASVRQLVFIAAVQVLVMATWFSASAVVPALRAEWALGTAGATWLTVSVQLGFVTGALTAALLNLADRASTHGGSFDLGPAPGRGTRLRWEVPLAVAVAP